MGKENLDPINKPAYYYNEGKADVGPLDYAEQQSLSIAQHAVVKYVTRAGRKPGNTALKDYRQAMFYLQRLVEAEEAREAKEEEDKVREERLTTVQCGVCGHIEKHDYTFEGITPECRNPYCHCKGDD